MPSELDIKTERVAGLAAASGYGVVLLNGQHNFAWITGGASNEIDNSRDAGAASILITREGKRYIVANKIEMSRMLAEVVSPTEFEPFEFRWQDEKLSADWVVREAGSMAGGQVVTDLPVSASVPSLEKEITQLRGTLTKEEVLRYRELGRDAGIALKEAMQQVRPGQTEIQIASAMCTELEKYGIRSVVTLVAVDDRLTNFRHPVPTSNKLRNTIMLVTCGRRHGLTVSLSRIATIGKVQPELLRKTEAAAFVISKVWHSTREGVFGRDLYRIAEQAYSDRGFADEIEKHHQGGATGYRTRDWVAHPFSEEIVFPDQAFAWNPSITGTKVEETVIASNGNCEVITASPDWPTITHTIDGVDYHSPGILEI